MPIDDRVHLTYGSGRLRGNLLTSREAERTKTTGVDELVERVRSRRQLPVTEERRRIREAAGCSLRDVATAIGVSHTAVASWESGATPRAHRVAYARLLDELRSLALDPEGGGR